MASYASLAALFSAIASAIRAKTGQSAQIVANDFPDAIAAIPSGGGGGTGLLQPINRNIRTGWVASGGWYYAPSHGLSADIYLLDGGHHYVVGLCSPVGNRFRVAYFSTNPANATTNLSGTAVGTDADDPTAFQVKPVFTAQSSMRYLAVFKSNNGTGDAAAAFVMDMDLITVP